MAGVIESGIQSLLVYLLGTGVVGLTVWVWALWVSHNNLKLKVAEEYLKNESLAELKTEIHSLRDVVYRIALKMEVPVFSEQFRR